MVKTSPHYFVGYFTKIVNVQNKRFVFITNVSSALDYASIHDLKSRRVHLRVGEIKEVKLWRVICLIRVLKNLWHV